MNSLHRPRIKAYPRKFYCPTCGQVEEGYHHWTQGWIVKDHSRMTAPWRMEQCPGGPVDLEEDRVK